MGYLKHNQETELLGGYLDLVSLLSNLGYRALVVVMRDTR